MYLYCLFDLFDFIKLIKFHFIRKTLEVAIYNILTMTECEKEI